MHRYLMLLGVVIMVLGVVGGALYLSGSYNEYQSRLHALGAGPGAQIAMFDDAKWGFSRAVGVVMIFGGVIWGSLLMGIGWMGKTMEDVRDALTSELATDAPQASHQATSARN